MLRRLDESCRLGACTRGRAATPSAAPPQPTCPAPYRRPRRLRRQPLRRSSNRRSRRHRLLRRRRSTDVCPAVGSTACRFIDAAGDRLRRTIRHPLGGLGRRRGARARRHLSGALFDRAGPDRPAACGSSSARYWPRPDRRRRMDAAQGELSGIAGVPSPHIPSMLTAAGTTVAYATVYAAYALYGFLGPAAAFVLLGIVALATLGGGAAARAGARRPRPRRRLCGAAAGRRPRSRITGRFTSISPSSLRQPSRWRGCGCGSGSRSRRSCSARLDVSGDVAGGRRRSAPHVFHACRLCACRAAHRLRHFCRAAGRTEPDRPFSSRRSRSICCVAAFLVLVTRHDHVALIAFVVAHDRDGRHRLAHRSSDRRRAGRCRCCRGR